MLTKKPKVVVVGDGGVGKTSMIVRYTSDKFTLGYEPTLINNCTAQVPLPDGTSMEIDIADTAGQEDYRALRDKFIAEGDAFLVVFSVSASPSLQAAENLLEEIQIIRDGEELKFVLAGNKCDIDQSERQVVNADAVALAQRFGGTFIETSAKTNVGINDVFAQLGHLLTAKPSGHKKADGSGGCCLVC